MNKTFDTNRFGNLLRYEFLSGWKSKARLTAIIFFILTYIYMSSQVTIDRTSPWAEEDLKECLSGCNETSSWLFILFMALYAGTIFKNMKTKQQRITFLTLPASRLEKYLCRLTDVTVGGALCFAVAMAAADVTQMALNMIRTPDCFGSVTAHYTGIHATDTVTLFVLWLHSSYVLGGALFRRHHILLTTVTHFAVTLVLMIASPFILPHVFDYLSATGTIYEAYNPYGNDAADDALNTFLAVFFLFDHIAAYMIYTRMQVINNKWFNL